MMPQDLPSFLCRWGPPDSPGSSGSHPKSSLWLLRAGLLGPPPQRCRVAASSAYPVCVWGGGLGLGGRGERWAFRFIFAFVVTLLPAMISEILLSSF